MPEDKDFQNRMLRVEALVRDIEATADPDTRSKAVELVQSLMEFHGAGLERVMEIVAEAGEPGQAVFADFARDSLVGSMLLLYGLHPVEFEARVMQALDKVRPYLASHKGGVELVGVSEGVVRLRMQGSCDGCPSSAMTLKLAIEEAIYEAAPDVAAIEVEGVLEPKAAPSGLVQLGRSNGEGGAAAPPAASVGSGSGKWEEVSGLESLAQGSVRTLEVSGRAVLFCRLGETLYAYDTVCPDCGQTLKDASLESASLACPACGQRFDVMRAGRGIDRTHLQLAPFPLLVEQSRAKVALPHLATS